MRELAPFVLRPEGYSPPEGDYWTRPEWYDEQLGEPCYATSEVARFFFGRSRGWLAMHLNLRRLELDGVPYFIPRDVNNSRRWRLVDVEVAAHCLAQNGHLRMEQLLRTIAIVKLVAENYEWLLPSPINVSATLIQDDDESWRGDGLMAVETLTQTRDDLDGSLDAVTRHFAIGEIHYSVDLVDKNWEAFLEAISPWVTVARPDRRRRLISPEEQEERRQIRDWAQAEGLPVGARGKIPYSVVDAYKKAREQ